MPRYFFDRASGQELRSEAGTATPDGPWPRRLRFLRLPPRYRRNALVSKVRTWSSSTIMRFAQTVPRRRPDSVIKTMSDTEKPVGLIGLGLVGSALAERFLAAGYAVVGFDVDAARCDELRCQGGTVAGSAAEVAGAARRIVLSLPDSTVVHQVIESLRPVLAPRHDRRRYDNRRPRADRRAGRSACRGGHRLHRCDDRRVERAGPLGCGAGHRGGRARVDRGLRRPVRRLRHAGVPRRAVGQRRPDEADRQPRPGVEPRRACRGTRTGPRRAGSIRRPPWKSSARGRPIPGSWTRREPRCSRATSRPRPGSPSISRMST